MSETQFHCYLIASQAGTSFLFLQSKTQTKRQKDLNTKRQKEKKTNRQRTSLVWSETHQKQIYGKPHYTKLSSESFLA